MMNKSSYLLSSLPWRDPGAQGRARQILALLLVTAPWGGLLAWLAHVAWFLCDDAFISFRYARNLLEGHGLVFNPGEYVEGYSNFLWTLELALLWALFDLPPEQVAPWLSVACTVATIATMLWWVVRTPRLQERRLVAWMALGLVCSSATFAVWTSGGGLETRQFTFFILLGVVSLALYRHSRWGLLTTALSLTAAAYTRPEGPLVAACCFAWFAIQHFLTNRRLPWRELGILVGPFVLLVAAHYLFRYSYYGEWLPNTYYAKYVRPWHEAGFRYLVAAALETGLYMFLPFACLALWTRWRSYRDGTYGLVLLCVAVHMAYVMRIGGDMFEYRPLDFYWPLLAVPAAEGIVRLGAVIAGGLGRMRLFVRGGGVIANPYLWALLLFVPVLFYSSAMQGVLLFKGAEIRGYNKTIYIELTEEDAGWLLAAPGMPMLVDLSDDLRQQTSRQTVGRPFVNHREYARKRIQGWKPYEKMARGWLPDDAVTSISGLGISSYYLPDLKVIDSWGLTDATIARNPVTKPNHERYMAHDRQPPPGYLEQRGVNILIYRAAFSEEQALARGNYALKIGPELWMPFGVYDHQWAIERFADWDLRVSNHVTTTINQYESIVSGEMPVLRAHFDIYLRENDITYIKYPCSLSDTQAKFFLYIVPTNSQDLPDERKPYGFDNIDFRFYNDIFFDNGVRFNRKCIMSIDRPEYDIERIKTGQFVSDKDTLWEGEVSVHENNAAKTDAYEAEYKSIVAHDPILRAHFDLYLRENDITYVKNPCSLSDTQAKFFLHITPHDVQDLPDRRKPYGFDNLDFPFYDHGVRFNGKCIVSVDRPEYEIERIVTGQFSLWKDEILLQVYELSAQETDAYNQEYESIVAHDPVLRAHFDLYLRENNITYVKYPCSLTDTQAKFFLHIIPHDVQDLPNDRKPHGFDNLDFSFYDHGLHFDGKCMATVGRPEYRIKHIKTGQFLPDEGKVWEREFSP